MNFTIPELQSMIDMNSNQIAKQEQIVWELQQYIIGYQQRKWKIPPSYYTDISKHKKDIARLANRQRNLKYAMRDMVDKMREDNAYTFAGLQFKKYDDLTGTPQKFFLTDEQIKNIGKSQEKFHEEYNSGPTTVYFHKDKSGADEAIEAMKPKSGIGDVNSTEKGSGARFNDNKPDFSLIPLHTLEDEAKVWMYGEKKYARNNWKKGMKWSVPFACAMRHLSQWQNGEDIDKESGLPHLAHVQCNIRMLTFYAENYKEGDDRF